MKHSLYRNFYKCFLLVMLLPTTILSITLIFFNSYVYMQNTKSLATHVFSVLEKELQYNAKQLSGCRSSLSTDLNLLNVTTETDLYDKFLLIQKLREIKNILGFCNDIGTFNIENQLVLSSNGESTFPLYFNAFDLDQLQDMCISMNEPYLLYPYGAKATTRFLYLCKVNSSPDSFLFFTFDSYFLYNTISDMLKESQGSVFLENPDTGEVFILGDRIDEDIRKQYLSNIAEFPETSRYMTHRSATVGRFPLAEYGLLLYIFIPPTAMYQSLLTILLISAGILIFSFLSGLLLVRYMARANYTPIVEIRGLIPREHLSDTENELIQINRAIIQMNEEISDLNTKININRENIKKSILIKLLYHQYPSEKEFLEDARVLNIQNLHPFFTICILHYEEKDTAPLLYEYLTRKDFPDCNCFFFNSMETDRLILIFNFQQDTCDFQAFIKLLSKDIFDTLGKNITVGVSSQHQPFEQIPLLYEQAVQALSYSFVTGKHTITFAPQIHPSGQTASAPLPEIDYDRLEKYVLGCNDDLLILFFYEVFATIQKSGHTLNNIKIYLFDMFSRIRRMLFNLNITDYQIIDNELASIFMNSETIEDLFNSLYAVMVGIGENLHTVSNEDKIDMIQKYIYEHLCDIDFNVNSISEFFHISLPTLSRFYKQNQNENISTFINKLKIEKTKELLTTSDHSIEYIVEKLGYSNSSSFIRKFKASVGMTPGQYRQQYKD